MRQERAGRGRPGRRAPATSESISHEQWTQGPDPAWRGSSAGIATAQNRTIGNTLRRNVYDTNGRQVCAVAGNTNGGGNRGTDNALKPDVDFNYTQ